MSHFGQHSRSLENFRSYIGSLSAIGRRIRTSRENSKRCFNQQWTKRTSPDEFISWATAPIFRPCFQNAIYFFTLPARSRWVAFYWKRQQADWRSSLPKSAVLVKYSPPRL